MAVARSELDAYFLKFRINELLKELAEDLALHRPQDPQRHLMQRLMSMTGEVEEDVKAMTPRPPVGVSFLRVNVECQTKLGSCMRLFSRNAASEITTATTVEAWRQAAETMLTNAVNEAQGTAAGGDRNATKNDTAGAGTQTALAEGAAAGEGSHEVAVLREEIKKLQALIHELEHKLHETQTNADFARTTSLSSTGSRRRRSLNRGLLPDPEFRRKPSAGASDDHMPADMSLRTPGRAEGSQLHKIGYKKDTTATCDLPPVEGCWLRIIQVNDVYELKNWPSFDSVLRHHSIANTITVLPGDFLAPGLLSSLDKGKGMVDIMNQVGARGIEYVCFGNHETDVPYEELVKRIDEYKGCWINSNMPDFRCNKELPEYKVVEVEGGGQKRKVGLLGLCTVDKNLYQAGAFGGAMATALPVYETAANLRKKLLEEEGCDLVIPMTHQVMADDRQMAQLQLGFPLILGAHDHEPYVEQVEGAWIVKAGMDAQNALIIDIKWPSPDTSGEMASVDVELVRCDDYRSNLELQRACDAHMQQVVAMEKAFLCEIPAALRPLTSLGVRRGQRTAGTLVASFVRDALQEVAGRCECVVMDAGCIRRNYAYPEDQASFSFGDLKKEVPFDTEMAVVALPGRVLQAAIRASRARADLEPPQDHGGYLQLCDRLEWDEAARELSRVGGEALDAEREYSVGVLAVSLNGMNRNQPLIDWANRPGARLPGAEECFPAKDLLVRNCSERLLAQVGDMARFDKDNSGYLDAGEIKLALKEIVGGQEVPEVMVDNLMRIVDEDNDGRIDAHELNQFVSFFKQMHSFKVHDTSGCNLRIIQCNDVYELKNWPSFDSLIRHHALNNTITVLPGDFLAPSLLSSLDKGKGMVDIMNQVGTRGIEYVCFGNHETDVPYEELVKRIDEYKGCWINSNMPDFRCNKELPEYKVVEVEGGGQKRKVGLLGLCTVDKNLYQAGAFGGAMATALPVYETAANLRKKLLEEEGCDLVIPMTHQVMADDRQMAQLQLGFPLILGAHDHEPYVEQVEGAWIVKTGMDAQHAAVIDIKWPSPDTPGGDASVTVEMLDTRDYPASSEVLEAVKKHMRAVEEMEAAYLCSVPPTLPLSSKGIRRRQTSVGTMLTSLIRDGLRGAAGQELACEGVMMDAGAIRRGYEYPEGYPRFTYGDLKKEVPFDSEMVVVSLPGAVIADAVAFSRQRAYFDPPEDWGGYMQLDDGFSWDEERRTVTKINSLDLEPARLYRVACLALSLNGMNRNQPLIEWANANPSDVPDDDGARQAKDLIVDCCARVVWSQMGSFNEIDADQDGIITVEEVQQALAKTGKEVSRADAQNLVNAIDSNDDGAITKEELEQATRALGPAI